jgi:hypothetical protein
VKENHEELNLEYLSITFPYLQDYEMIDWMIFLVSIAGLSVSIRNRSRGLFLLMISDILWVTFDLCIEECPIEFPFLLGSAAIAWGYRKHYIQKESGKFLEKLGSDKYLEYSPYISYGTDSHL